MHTYTLFELNEFTRRVIALNFPSSLWITAEIAQCKASKGSFYLDLVQKKDDTQEIIAQTAAVLWPSDLMRLRKTHKSIVDELLQGGLEVRIQVRVEFHERYGLKLVIDDIDPTWTLGALEIQRRETIQKLEAMGILRRNATHALPVVLQRIAVISSESAAGYQDFVQHLLKNNFGYAFQIILFNTSVQGNAAVTELQQALDMVRMRKSDFDIVVIVRGGGAKLDLAAFDAFELCKAVAHYPLPVFSGIGHETDVAVLDMVTHTSMKTPTAVADFIIHYNMMFESNLLQMEENMKASLSFKVQESTHALKYQEFLVNNAVKNFLKEKRRRLQEQEEALPLLWQRFLELQKKKLDDAANLCKALDPKLILKKGFTRTLVNGKQVYSSQAVKPGDTILTQWIDGSVQSEVVNKNT